MSAEMNKEADTATSEAANARAAAQEAENRAKVSAAAAATAAVLEAPNDTPDININKYFCYFSVFESIQFCSWQVNVIFYKSLFNDPSNHKKNEKEKYYIN